MQQLDQDGSYNTAVLIAGNGNTVTIQSGAARLTLAQRHQRQRPPKKDLDLLDPYRCPIDLVGRRHDLDSLTAWLDSPAPIAVQCRIGRAGSGKTRLALELCKAAEAQDWTAGFLVHDELTRFQAAGHVRDWAWPAPTLVVVDYAATSAQPLRNWLEDLVYHDPGDHPPLRLLLLERHASRELGWWADLTRLAGFSTDAIEDLFDPPEPLELTRVSTAADRRALLEAIMAEAAKLTGKPAPPLPAPGTDATFDAAIAQGAIELEPLYLLMAGLTAVQTGVPHVLALTRTDLADRLAARELDRLAALAEARGINPTLVQHLTACIGLMNGCQSDQLATLVTEEAASLGHTLLTGPDPVAHLLADTLASDRPDRLDPIRPDLIGEAAILETFERHRRSADWQAATVIRAFDRAGPETTATIIRTAQDFATGALDHPSLLWLDQLADHVQDVRHLCAIAARLPKHTVNLGERAAAILTRITDLTRGVTANHEALRPDLAFLLNNLGHRLSQLGRHEAALAATEEAVAVYRELAAAPPEAFRPDLAGSLNNLGAELNELGRHEAALAATEEAVAVYRELAATRPDAFKPELAGSLNNLGAQLSELGRHEAALAAIEEAVAVCRELAAIWPDGFMPNLAMSLNNLGAMLSALRQSEAALASEEAVAIYRELAAARPDAFKRYLAVSLNDLGNTLSALGRREAALAATEEAVAMYRELAAARPDAHLLGLALSLATRADCLEGLDRLDEALASNAEAIETLRPTFLSNPMAVVRPMRPMCDQYLKLLRRLGAGLDAALLEPILEVFRALQAQSQGEQP